MKPLTPKQYLVTMAMTEDKRVPCSELGYIGDIQSPGIDKTALAERLAQLSRYVPDLVCEFVEAGGPEETCFHCGQDGRATEADPEEFEPGDERPVCGRTLGADGGWETCSGQVYKQEHLF